MFVHNTLASTHFVAQSMAINMYLFHVYLPIGFIGHTKSNPHFINVFFKGKVVTNFAKFYVANLLMH
jgi:hypothetical protein